MITDQSDLAEMLSADDSEASIKRNVYKYTNCGAFIALHPWGIEIGSIVEGSENGTETYMLQYPFTVAQYEACMQAIEKESSAIWDWANVVRFHCLHQTLDATGTKVVDCCDWSGGADDVEDWADDEDTVAICPKCGAKVEGATDAEGGLDFPDLYQEHAHLHVIHNADPEVATEYDEYAELRRAGLNHRGEP